jgi:hypothetical protein
LLPERTIVHRLRFDIPRIPKTRLCDFHSGIAPVQTEHQQKCRQPKEKQKVSIEAFLSASLEDELLAIVGDDILYVFGVDFQLLEGLVVVLVPLDWLGYGEQRLVVAVGGLHFLLYLVGEFVAV